MPESVHLCDYLIVDTKAIDENLEEGMNQIRALVESGRALRSKLTSKEDIRYNPHRLSAPRK